MIKVKSVDDVSEKNKEQVKGAGSRLRPAGALSGGVLAVVALAFIKAPTSAYIALGTMVGGYLVGSGIVLAAIAFAAISVEDEAVDAGEEGE